MALLTTRAGRFVKQPTGYRAFVPASLPPDPAVNFDSNLIALLSRADQALGRLDGVTQILPNPDLFVAMYVRREAVLSSQIEGTQSTLDDVLAFELDAKGYELPQDIKEVVNYVGAMNYGLERLTSLPLSLRLIREIHEKLLLGTRGDERHPGEFRSSQNWIGQGNTPLSRATFVPPPHVDMHRALDNFEKFLHEDNSMPLLIHCGLAHAQFETIHPFLDGNGRVGRLLITFILVNRQALHRPLLYLSHYLKRNRRDYYESLMAVRQQGDWEGWLRFFLEGVAVTADEAAITARSIVELREQHRTLLQKGGHAMNALRLLDLLFERPLVNIGLVKNELDIAFVTARSLVEQFQRLGLLDEITGGQRNRVYRYTLYLGLFEDREEDQDGTVPLQTTEVEA